MLAELINDSEEVPKWILQASINDELPLLDILRRSMFYPACGYDGRAVQYFCGAVHSFVYVDFSCPRETVVDELKTFKGYRPVFVKDVNPSSLNIKSFERHKDIVKNSGEFNHFRKPFFSYAIWVIFERLEEFDPTHGPERFSLLYIGGEAISVYWSLYWRNWITPFAITLIRCDGFTCNWTSFFHDKAELANFVMCSPFNTSKYLLSKYRERDASSPWQWFNHRIKTFHSGLDYSGEHHDHLTVWRRTPAVLSIETTARMKEGFARADLLDELAATKIKIPLAPKQSQRYHNRRRTINNLIKDGINPLFAAYFKYRLSIGCIEIGCTTCGGIALTKHIKALSKSEILEYLSRLEYQQVDHFEMEIRSTYIYIKAGSLSDDELVIIENTPAINILKKMIEHHSNRHQMACLNAERDEERKLLAKQRHADLATARLPNAIRRKDKLAVFALINKGADLDFTHTDGRTSRDIAVSTEVGDWIQCLTLDKKP